MVPAEFFRPHMMCYIALLRRAQYCLHLIVLLVVNVFCLLYEAKSVI